MSAALTLGSADAKLPEACDVAIVGGGVMGLATAYHIAATSKLRVVVLERSYLVSGASGRNGGGVRMQWGDEGNVRIMMESIEICRGLAQELGINLWFRQGGYLFLARSEAGEQRLRRNAALHHSLGAPTRLLGPEEARDVVPELDVREVRLAAFNPDDGVVFPWPFVWGYARQAIRRGVVVRTHTAALAAEADGAGLALRLSSGERLRAGLVINATGAWCHGLNHSLGVRLPNRPHRHEILSTEPLKPFLTPMVSLLSSGLYFSQSTRGEIVCGVTAPDHDGDEVKMGSRLLFLETLAAELCAILPRFAGVKVLRQWAGPYDLTPDGHPILGEPDGVPGYYLCCGFMGHGFMMAPVISKHYAALLSGDAPHPVFAACGLARFQSGPLHPEEMIIG